MKKKIVGIIVMALLTSTVLPISASWVKQDWKKEFKTNLLTDSWYHTFGGNGNDGFYGIVEAHDNGCLAAGFTNSYGEGSYDGWLVKTDTNVWYLYGDIKA